MHFLRYNEVSSITCNTGPVRVDLGMLMQGGEFIGTTIIRSSYSAQLNHFEEYWSVVKSAMKHQMAGTFETILSSLPAGITQSTDDVTAIKRCLQLPNYCL